MVNFDHQAHVFMDSWCIPTKTHNKTQQLKIFFIVNVYATCWFEIKRNSKFHNQQLHIFNMIQRIKDQPHEIQPTALRNIQGNTFCLLPENLLYSMVKSEEVEVREEALKRILAMRK